MNPIETLKYHNKWRRNGEGEMCNPAELGVAIDTVIADYEVMQKENDELRAKVEIMTKLGSDMADELQANYNNQQTRLMSMKWYKEIDSSNSQSLADIKAEDIDGFINDFRYEFEGPRDTDSIESFADQYIANRVKGG